MRIALNHGGVPRTQDIVHTKSYTLRKQSKPCISRQQEEEGKMRERMQGVVMFLRKRKKRKRRRGRRRETRRMSKRESKRKSKRNRKRKKQKKRTRKSKRVENKFIT